MTVADALASPPIGVAVPAQEVLDGNTMAAQHKLGIFGRVREALFGARVDDELSQKEQHVPPLALVLSILGGLGYLAYIGHAEIVYIVQVDWAYKIAPAFLFLLLLAQDFGSDWSMIRSMPRFAVYIRRNSLTYRVLAMEMLLYILTVGGTMTLTLYGIASATDRNPGAVVSSQPLVAPNDPLFNAVMILRAVLFFWTMVQLVLTNGKIPADMLTMKEMWIGKLGAYVREVLLRMEVKKQHLGPALRVFAAAFRQQSDEEFAKAVEDFGVGSEERIRQDERTKALAEAERASLARQQQLEATFAEDRIRFMQQTSELEDRLAGVTDAIRLALHAIAGGEDIPAEALSVVPDLGLMAKIVRRRPAPARPAGDAAPRARANEAPVDDDVPLGAIKVSGKPFGANKAAVALVATAGSAGKLVNVKDDTLRNWIVKANARALRGADWVAGARGAACMPYEEMLSLIAESAADKLQPGVDLDALRSQAAEWRSRATVAA